MILSYTPHSCHSLSFLLSLSHSCGWHDVRLSSVSNSEPRGKEANTATVLIVSSDVSKLSLELPLYLEEPKHPRALHTLGWTMTPKAGEWAQHVHILEQSLNFLLTRKVSDPARIGAVHLARRNVQPQSLPHVRITNISVCIFVWVNELLSSRKEGWEDAFVFRNP